MDVDNYCAPPKQGTGQTTSETEQHTRTTGGNTDGGKQPSPAKRILWAFLGLLVVLIVVALVIFMPLVNKRANHTAIVKVPKGATEQQLTDTLSKYFGEDYAASVVRGMQITGGGSDKLRYGAWQIKEGDTPIRAARTLTHGGQASITLSFNNERTPRQVAAKVAGKLNLSADQVLDAMNDDRFMARYDLTSQTAMALFMADSFDFYWTASVEDLFNKLYENYDAFWTAERLKRAENLGLSQADIMTLASIVDEETNATSEKGIIGRLYLNRLQEGMKLQADPTVRYALGDFTIKRVGGDMLKTDSPYNTYMYEGLPPGPIRVVSGKTVDAILSSQPNEYMYMCAKEDFSGTHNFAVTYEEHQANARRYQQALDARGIN